MAAASPKPKGKLTKNKYVIAGVIVVAGALFYFYYKNKNASSSAGTSSTPQSADTGAGLTPSDSTGGGSGTGPDLSGLFNLLASDNSLIAQLVGNGGSGGSGGAQQPVAPVTSTQGRSFPTFIPPSPTAPGGNVTPQLSPSQPSQPTTSHPQTPAQAVSSITAAQPNPPENQILQAIRAGTVFSGSGVISTPQTATSGNPVGANVGANVSTANDLNDVMYSPPLVTLATTKSPPPKKAPAPKSGYSQGSGANLH